MEEIEPRQRTGGKRGFALFARSTCVASCGVGGRRYCGRMLDSFHPAVRSWFARRFAAGHHTLIAAPTGSGKTLAAFLVCIDRIYRTREAGADPAAGPQVVYVSPLKALAVDIWQNLEAPLAEIASTAAGLG